MDPDGGKLSKRKGSTSCMGLLNEGYLPEAILNFIMLLGWAPKKNEELFSLESFVKAFDHSGFQKSNPVFNREKLDWFNGHYLRQASDEKLTEMLFEFLKGEYSKDIIAITVPLIKERIVKLSDYLPIAEFFFAAKKPDKTFFGPNKEKHLKASLEVLENIKVWGKEEIDSKLMEKVKEEGFKTGDFFMDLRVAITGVKFTPPINDSIVILGKEESIKRIKDSLE
jgi:glutamyl-tRNA synthetase